MSTLRCVPPPYVSSDDSDALDSDRLRAIRMKPVVNHVKAMDALKKLDIDSWINDESGKAEALALCIKAFSDLERESGSVPFSFEQFLEVVDTLWCMPKLD